MATPIVVANAAQVILNWSGPQRTWRNVLGAVGNPTLPTINQAYCEALYTSIRGNGNVVAWMGQLSSLAILESISVRSLNTPNQPLFTSTGAPLGGAGTTDILPLNTAVVVTVRTALAGKSFRGRVYLTGIDEAQNDVNGRIAVATNTAAVAFIQGINSAFVANGIAFAVISRPAAARTIPARTLNARAGGVVPAASFQTRTTKWNSQRRRTGRS